MTDDTHDENETTTPDAREIRVTAPTQAERVALAEIIGAIGDVPRGSNEVTGRAFGVLMAPIKDVVMAVCSGDREDLGYALDDLVEARVEVKEMRR